MQEVLGSIGQTGDDLISLWWFAIFIVAFYSPLAWVRNIKYFSLGYIIGCAMIVFTIFVVSGYCVSGLIKTGPENADTFFAVNPNIDKIWAMIGFSFYTFEGIGPVMPIYRES